MGNITTDRILSIEIDEKGRLHIKPEKSKFTLIYRTATEVHWTRTKELSTLLSQEIGIIWIGSII